MTALAALREFVRARPDLERCGLCAIEVGPAHEHLLEPERLELTCACVACARVLGTGTGRFRLVQPRARRLADFRVTDDAWRALGLPIELAFFVRSSARRRVVAVYPSAAGRVESPVASPPWDALVAANPVVAGLEPDVEALLVDRRTPPGTHYRVSIDEGYRLIGLMRRHWRGLGGGPEVWAAVAAFFAHLDARCEPA